MGPCAINRSRLCDRGCIRVVVAALIIGVCAGVAGCNATETTWTAQSRSPDGGTLASARTVARSGFGTAFIFTSVTLSTFPKPASETPTEVVRFSDEYETPEKTRVAMRWLTSKHLEVTYGGPMTLTFQAVKSGDIAISVRDQSSDTTSKAQ